MRKLLTFLFLSTIIAVSGQTPIIYNNSGQQSFLLSYAVGGNESQRNINEMLETVARFIPKPVQQTRVTLSLSENVRITRANRELTIYVGYDDIHISGDYLYKGFDISEQFIPSHYQWTGLLSRRDGQELKRFSLSESGFSPRNNENTFTYLDTVNNGEYVFTIESRAFLYKSQAYDRFRSRVRMIDDYYLADADLNQCYQSINQVNPDAFENINGEQQKLDDVGARAQAINRAAFWTALDISHFDPIRLYPKMNEVNSLLTGKQDKLNYTRSVLHVLYYEKALGEYNNKQRKSAREDFLKSAGINNAYAQPVFYLAIMDFEDGLVDDAMTGIERVFAMNHVDQDISRDASDFAKYLEKAKLNLVRNDIGLKKYDKALDGLDRVDKFCKAVPAYTCNDSVKIMRADCHNFIYQDILLNAGRLFAQSKFPEAIDQADKAIAYQDSHRQYIATADQAVKLKETVNAEYYLDLVKNGKTAYNTRNFSKAFELLYKAYYIEQHYTVKKDKALYDLMKKSKGELLLADATNAADLVRQNRLPEAKTALKKIMDEQAQFDLAGMQSLNQKIEELKKSIFNQQCINAQNEYDAKIKEAEALVAQKSYIMAKARYESALGVSTNNRDCAIDKTAADKGISYCTPPAQYQQAMSGISNMVRNRNFTEATDEYLRQGEFFSRNNLAACQLTHMPLPEYIVMQGSDYVFFGVSYFISRGAYETSFAMLDRLKYNGYNKKYTKDLQVSLARVMAIEDLKKNSMLNAKLRVSDLTKGDKWFSYFSKAYLKQVKKLK